MSHVPSAAAPTSALPLAVPWIAKMFSISFADSRPSMPISVAMVPTPFLRPWIGLSKTHERTAHSHRGWRSLRFFCRNYRCRGQSQCPSRPSRKRNPSSCQSRDLRRWTLQRNPRLLRSKGTLHPLPPWRPHSHRTPHPLRSHRNHRLVPITQCLPQNRTRRTSIPHYRLLPNHHRLSNQRCSPSWSQNSYRNWCCLRQKFPRWGLHLASHERLTHGVRSFSLGRWWMPARVSSPLKPRPHPYSSRPLPLHLPRRRSLAPRISRRFR